MSVIFQKSVILSLLIVLFTGCDYEVTTNIKEGSVISDNTAHISFEVKHHNNEHMVDLGARVLSINGNDRTVDTTVTRENNFFNSTTRINYQPTVAFTLPQGDVTIKVTVPYKSRFFRYFDKKAMEEELHIVVDSIAPTITDVSPEDGASIVDPYMPLTYAISDSGQGVDASSIKFIINGEDKSSQAVFENDILTYTPSNDSPLPLSSFKVDIAVKDVLGNESNATYSYAVQPKIVLGAFPRAVPQTAVPGATIRFSPVVTTDTAIQRYDWDLDGDGIFEHGDLIGNTYTHTYSNSGDYNVSLKVRDAKGEVLIGSTIVHIQNLPPQVSAEATPSNGEVPLEVTFVVSASDNEGIAKYEWDFNGDGSYDYESVTTGNTLHTYTTLGNFSPKIRVTDSTGISSTYTLPTTTVNVAIEGSPTVTGAANVSSGGAPLSVSLSATANDPQNKGFTLWEWDYNGDGVYDYDSNQSANVNHIFTRAGTHFPRVRVTTTDGRQSVDAIEIQVANTISISRDANTIDTALGEVATITTTIGADTKVSIVLESRSNQVVRTLVDWSDRVAGTYSDTWDGRSNDGSKIAEGDYYAVLLYENDGEVKRVDLRDSTGGTQFNPSRDSAKRSFAPFDNDPMNITFTLNQAAEVTAFMGYSYSNTRVVTFFSRQPMGKGKHNVKWYSTNNEGVIIKAPTGKYFMYGNWAYTLSDNAIYVKSGAHLTGVSVKPVIYDPTSHKEEGLKSTANISFKLTADASVELTVVDAQTGVTVAYKKYSDLLAGENTIEWDGRNSAGEFIAPGNFRIGVRAVDETGYSSLLQYTLLRIFY